MKILIVSDTHGKNIIKLIQKIKNVDYIIHLGDNYKDVFILEAELNKPTHFVKGNCDFGPGVDTRKIISIAGKRIFITHGHLYKVKQGLDDLKANAFRNNVDIALFGHTHDPQIFVERGITFLNPGSPAYPARGAYPTIGIIEIKEGQVRPCIIRI